MDFEEAERSEPTQALELTPDDIKEDGIIQLRYVKFQNVNSVTVSKASALSSVQPENLEFSSTVTFVDLTAGVLSCSSLIAYCRLMLKGFLKFKVRRGRMHAMSLTLYV